MVLTMFDHHHNALALIRAPVSGTWDEGYLKDVVLQVRAGDRRDRRQSMPLRIEDYAIIGDTQSAALVGDGSNRLAVSAQVRLRGDLRGAAG
jgi:hypothetical protein